MSKQKLVSKSKSLSIDLSCIHNPNAAILDAYTKSGAMDQYMDFRDCSEFVNESKIYQFSAGTKRNPSGQKIKHKIISLYRVRSNNVEYCYMYNWMKTTDLLGNPHDWTRVLGKFSIPVFSTEFAMSVDENDPSQVTEGSAGGTSIERVETRYLYPWEQVKEQLQTWVKEKILDPDTCNYTIIYGTAGRKYTVQSFEEFLELDLDSLLLLNRIGLQTAGLQLSNKEILSMARSKALENVTKSLGQEVKVKGVK
jgi:hypothetical protein